jgi:hypothetical protein
MKGTELFAIGALVLAAWLASRSETLVTVVERSTNRDVSDVNEPTGDMADVWADRADELSDAVDEAVRNEERYVGVPVSPYQ